MVMFLYMDFAMVEVISTCANEMLTEHTITNNEIRKHFLFILSKAMIVICNNKHNSRKNKMFVLYVCHFDTLLEKYI